ncbi:MAG: universal stress protein [Burkholderiaceae bacterium]
MYKKILVPIDGSETAHLALEHAGAIARLCEASVVLLHVIDDQSYSSGYARPSVYIRDVRPAVLRSGKELLDGAARELDKMGVSVNSVLIESHGERVAELIARQAAEQRCDLIALGTHGRRGVERLVIGSDAENLARIASVPVLLVRQPPAAAR